MGIIAIDFRSWGMLAGLAAATLAAGCVSADLSTDTKATANVIEALPTDTPAPAAIARAIWYPNARGFGTTGASPLGRASGVLALAGSKLWFMAWNGEERHYDMLHDVDVLTALTVSIDRAGPSAMLVIQSRTHAYDAFELMNGGQFTSDPKATQALVDQIEALRAKHPQADL